MSASERATALVIGFVALFPSVAICDVPCDFPTVDPEPWARGALGVHIENDKDLIPAFRAGPRDRSAVGAHGHWVASDRVVMDLSWSMLRDLHPSGESVMGPGDVELGTMIRLPIAEGLRSAAQARGARGPAFGLGWRVKLPNAADEGELGSDETDVVLVASAAGDLGLLRGWAGGGLAILGDPGQLAAQDDVVFLQAGLGLATLIEDRPWVPEPELSAGVALPSAGNPLRSELSASLRWGRTWSVVVSGGAGLSAASPTTRIGLGFERRFMAAVASNEPEDRR